MAEPRRPALRGPALLVSAAVLVCGIAFMVWLHRTVPPTERVDAPERALSLMVARTLDMEDGLQALPRWERFLYEGLSGNGMNELDQAILWYDELRAVSPNPGVAFEWAILEGEAGRGDAVRRLIHEWAGAADGPAAMADVLDGAYLTSAVTPARAIELKAELAELLPVGWFYDRVAIRLATVSGDAAAAAAARERITGRAETLLRRVRIFTTVELAMLALGAVTAVLMLRPRRSMRIGTAALPPPWRGRDGMAVLVHGGAAGIVLTILFLYLGGDNLAVRLLALPAAACPLILLARGALLAPAGQDLATGFGLRLAAAQPGRLVAALAAVLAGGLAGEWLLGAAAEWLQIADHWTEWFDADLVWGDRRLVAVALLEFVVFAPVVEEITFRGVLFGTLRRRFPFAPAAAISAGIFAIAHGYGVLGFTSVLWSGLLWAWVYERTGSLLPGMLAHALNNLLVCLSVMWLLRY